MTGTEYTELIDSLSNIELLKSIESTKQYLDRIRRTYKGARILTENLLVSNYGIDTVTASGIMNELLNNYEIKSLVNYISTACFNSISLTKHSINLSEEDLIYYSVCINLEGKDSEYLIIKASLIDEVLLQMKSKLKS